jgi:hypothetical protein
VEELKLEFYPGIWKEKGKRIETSGKLSQYRDWCIRLKGMEKVGTFRPVQSNSFLVYSSICASVFR